MNRMLVLLAASLAACGSDDATPAPPVATPSADAAAEVREQEKLTELEEEVERLKQRDRRRKEAARAKRAREAAAEPAPPPATAPVPDSGFYAGTASQRGGGVDKDFPVEMTFSSSGSSVTYPSLQCAAALRPTGWDGAGRRIYAEQVTRGHCTTGGVWHVTVLSGSRLTATWVAPTAGYTVNATLQR